MTVPLKRMLQRFVRGRTVMGGFTDDGEYPWWNPAALGEDLIIGEPKRHVPTGRVISGQFPLVPAGSTAFAFIGNIGRAALLDRDGIINEQMVGLVPTADTNPRFLAYICRAIGPTVDALAFHTVVRYLPLETLLTHPVVLPQIGDQGRIADFLDTETARIDALITKKRRLISLLEERAAVVRADTFGSRGRWRVKRVLRAPMAYGVLVPRFVDPAEGVPMARIGALNPDGTIAIDRVAYIEPAQGLEYRRTQTVAGDLVLSVVGSMGRSAVVDASVAGTNTNRPLARLQPIRQLPPRLLWHWTQTQLFMNQACVATGGDTAQPTLNLGALAEFDTGLPDDPATWAASLEQLEGRLAPIESASLDLTRQIELLAEKRQALITSAVTGELVVPGVAA